MCLLFQAIIHFGKVSRKHNLTGVCLQTLSRLYTIPNVPVVDCFHKIRQQVKCYMQMASISSNKHEIQDVCILVLCMYYKQLNWEGIFTLDYVLLCCVCLLIKLV